MLIHAHIFNESYISCCCLNEFKSTSWTSQSCKNISIFLLRKAKKIRLHWYFNPARLQCRSKRSARKRIGAVVKYRNCKRSFDSNTMQAREDNRLLLRISIPKKNSNFSLRERHTKRKKKSKTSCAKNENKT